MERVIATMVEYRVGCDKACLHPTRSVRGHHLSAKLSSRAALALARGGPSRIGHFHLSEKGSFVREGGLLRLARLLGWRTVVTNHGGNLPNFAKAQPALVRGVLEAADLVLCLSEEARAACESLGVCNSRLTQNPVPADLGSPPADQTDEVVLYAGKVSLDKGTDVLADAWARISAARPAAVCLVAGPEAGFSLPPIERLVPLGSVPPEEMGALLRRCRLVVLPSRFEASPMILIEALAARRPFVASAVGGIPALADGTQALVAPGSPEELAAGILRLLENPALARERGDAGFAQHLRTRDVAVVSRAMRDHYLSIGPSS